MRWFRFYDDALDNPKVQRLSGDLYKTWGNLLCLASKSGGTLPPLPDIAFRLRLSESEMAKRIQVLVSAGLLDEEPELHPHNWASRQYESDSAAERMRRHRKHKRDVTGDVTVTSQTPSPLRNSDATDTDTDTDTDTEKNKKQKEYKFAGKVVRLNAADFQAWKDAYHGIPDLEAELFRIDQVMASDGSAAKNWFIAASNMLAAKHQKFLAERKPEAPTIDGFPMGPDGRPVGAGTLNGPYKGSNGKWRKSMAAII